ncbi:YqcI/YcgG family protein [Alcaligenes ammonioxydans]
MLISQQDLHEKLPSMQAWENTAWNEIEQKIQNPDFPCIFSLKAWKIQSLYLVFCHKGSPGNEYEDFIQGLKSYSEFIITTPESERLFNPLLVVFSPDFHDGHSLLAHGWEALNHAHRHDPSPWPDSVSRNPDDASWSFCFCGIEYFINMSSPEHIQLQNRNLGSHLVFVINARRNFDLVANGQTPDGQATRTRIRDRVADYNQGFRPVELGSYGTVKNLEWKQYQLSEPQVPRPAICPFTQKKTGENFA